MVAGAVVAGVLVLGGGGRLMMRLLAVTSPDEVQGLLTDADEEVGAVTVDGTVGFVLFIGLFGGLVSLGLLVLLRRWLPDRSLLAGLFAAGIGAGIFARPTDLLNPDNRDFAILSPSWLAVTLGVGVIVLFGLTLAVMVDRWAPRWPRPTRSAKGVASALPLVPLVVFPPMLAAVVAGTGFAAFVAPKATELPWLGRLDAVAKVVVAAIALLGATSALLAALEILTL